MNFYFYSPVNFQKWDYRTPDIEGIGGSETSHIEMCKRLAKRGHKVVSYAPIPDDCPPDWMGTQWLPLEKATFKESGIWVIYRSPETLRKFRKKQEREQQVWFVSQDEWYPTWKKGMEKYVDILMPLCKAHEESILRHHPELTGKTRISSNGVKVDLIREIEKEQIVRNEKKIIYASSPDRGLDNLLKIFKKAREFDPELELHIFYGFDNVDKLIAMDKRFSGYKKMKKEIMALTKQPNVYFRGKVSQADLCREWFSSGIWCYPTNFTETSCITSMEAQACGALPITHPLWALVDNVKYGIFIEGDATDPLTQARFMAEIVRVIKDTSIVAALRKPMMNFARNYFNWERWVDQWESWIFPNFVTGGMFISQFNYQLKYAKGKILNVGCDVDPANFKKLGAVNIDIVAESPILKLQTKADIIADARDLPKKLYNQFDSVILGDILEHMSDEDIIKTLKSAKKCLTADGHIVITCPDDSRSVDVQHAATGNKEYAPGISSYHQRPLPQAHMRDLFEKAGLTVYHHQEIDYTMFLGNGFIVA